MYTFWDLFRNVLCVHNRINVSDRMNVFSSLHLNCVISVFSMTHLPQHQRYKSNCPPQTLPLPADPPGCSRFIQAR